MKGKLNPWEITIPITVDAVKLQEGYALTRCTYFSIEHKTPGSPATLGLPPDIEIPFLMIDLSGVITAPLEDDKQRFEDPGDLDSLFEEVDAHRDYYVDTNDFWLPTALLECAGPPVERGMTYRIGVELFRKAYALRDMVMSAMDLDSQMKMLDIPVMIEYSGKETIALKGWQDKLIASIRESYHANPQRKLPRKDERPRPKPTTHGLGN